jgi:hypothetical protein
LYVRDVSGTGSIKTRVATAVLEYVEFHEQLASHDQSATHFVEYRGPTLKYVVVRRKDGQVVSDGHADQAAGMTALNNKNRLLPVRASLPCGKYRLQAM